MRAPIMASPASPAAIVSAFTSLSEADGRAVAGRDAQTITVWWSWRGADRSGAPAKGLVWGTFQLSGGMRSTSWRAASVHHAGWTTPSRLIFMVGYSWWVVWQRHHH